MSSIDKEFMLKDRIKKEIELARKRQPNAFDIFFEFTQADMDCILALIGFRDAFLDGKAERIAYEYGYKEAIADVKKQMEGMKPHG